MKKNLFISIAIVMIVACFIFTAIFSLMSFHSIISESSKELSMVLAGRIHESISDELQRPIVVATTMAKDAFLRKALQEENTRGHDENVKIFKEYLRVLSKSMDYSSAFLVSDKSKAYYTHEGFNKFVDPKNDPHDIWYSLFVEMKKPYDLDVDVDQVNGNRWTVFVNAGIYSDEDEFLGATGVGVIMDNVQDMFYNYEKQYGVKINLIDTKGRILVDTDTINIENAYLEPPDVSKRKMEEYMYSMDDDGYKVMKFIEPLGGFLVIRGETSLAKSDVVNVIVINVIATLLIILIMLMAIRMVLTSERRMNELSFTDSLTGLGNRIAYDNRINLFKSRYSVPGALAILDINGLKSVNGQFGNDAGDELICGASKMISDFFGKMGACFRIGGDEFVVIFEEAPVSIKELRKDFYDMVSLWHGKHEETLSISMGVSFASDMLEPDVSTMIKLADDEMYKEKMQYYRDSGKERRRT